MILGEGVGIVRTAWTAGMPFARIERPTFVDLECNTGHSQLGISGDVDKPIVLYSPRIDRVGPKTKEGGGRRGGWGVGWQIT